MASIEFENVVKVYPGQTKAVIPNLNLKIEDKEFIILVGPSGCGKSTTLRMIAGLEDITRGTLRIDGKKVNDVPARDRDIAMVFQSYALYPNMTVYKNIAFPLKVRKLTEEDVLKRAETVEAICKEKGMSEQDTQLAVTKAKAQKKYTKEEINAKVHAVAKVLDLEQYLDRKPANLSGGQRQRVALGRAMVRSPKVFLLDEPLSNLDAKLRTEMRSQISMLHKKLNTTFVYVTHDQTEAMTIADKIAVFNKGVIQQFDTPRNLYERPTNLFVAGFIGSPEMNFLKAKLVRNDNRVDVKIGDQSFDVSSTLNSSGVLSSYLTSKEEEKKAQEEYEKEVASGEVKILPVEGNIEENKEEKKETKKDKKAKKEAEQVVEEVEAKKEYDEVTYGVRPENIILVTDENVNSLDRNTIYKVHVKMAEFLGAELYLYFDIDNTQCICRTSAKYKVKTDDDIYVSLNPNKGYIFNSNDETISFPEPSQDVTLDIDFSKDGR